MPATPEPSILSLDVGNARIGLAIASVAARLPRPLTTLANDEAFTANLLKRIEAEAAIALVIGLPRNLSGQSTEQTTIVESFVAELQRHVDIPIYMQDEALTSRQAESELQARGKLYDKGSIDALAATYILEDYLRDHKGTV